MSRDATRAGRRRAGFTLMEVLVSTLLLSFLILMAGVVTRGAMGSTARTVVLDATDARLQRTLHRVRQRLTAASLSTLEAVPDGAALPAPMADDVVYDNVDFRQVVGYAQGAPLYRPDPADAPMRLWFEADPAGGPTGTLWFDDGEQQVALMRGVEDVEVIKTGKRLAVAVRFARPDAKKVSISNLAVALVVP